MSFMKTSIILFVCLLFGTSFVNLYKIPHTFKKQNVIVSNRTELIEYYKELINSVSDSGLTYNDLPKNAKNFGAEQNSTLTDYGTYDFIIVGGGTTGAIIASRLSEISNWTILVLDPGNYGNNYTDISGLMSLNHTSAYESVTQTTACLGLVNRKCPYPRGRGIGGTSLINDLVYSRGNPQDFDRWASLGNPGWSYQDVFSYFLKSENFTQNDNSTVVDWEYHNRNGLLQVEYPLPEVYDNEIFIKANLEIGENITDSSGRHQLGVSVAQKNTKFGRRQDTGTAFIKPFLKHRKNLEISTGSYVTRIVFNETNKEATSVEFTKNGTKYFASSRKEIILSAGVLVSPQLLMLSGIGPHDHLEELGIPVISNLSVGQTLLDHSMYDGLTFSSNYSKPSETLEKLIDDFLNGFGTLTARRIVCGFYKLAYTNSSQTIPDIEIIMVAPVATSSTNGDSFVTFKDDTWNATFLGNNVNTTFKLEVLLLHPKSSGTIKLKSTDPFDYPLIHSNLLSDEANRDIEMLYKGVQLALALSKTEPFKKINATYQAHQLPACVNYTYLSDQYWYCALRQLTYSAFHPVGSCPMGPDPQNGAVVNSDLEVYGVAGLRVADASVFPTTISGNSAATCFMIGEKVSDVIKNKYVNESTLT